MIKHLLIKHYYNFNCKLLKHSYNQVTTNKIHNTKNIIKVSCLNLAAYNPVAYNLVAYNLVAYNLVAYKIKSTNKTFISYNHFKGSKKAFSYKPYNSIKLVRFWLVAMLKGFKIDINKIIRLKIYKWGLVEIIILISTNKINDVMIYFNKIILKMILISSFGWRDIITKKVWSKTSKIEACMRFPAQINPISDW